MPDALAGQRLPLPLPLGLQPHRPQQASVLLESFTHLSVSEVPGHGRPEVPTAAAVVVLGQWLTAAACDALKLEADAGSSVVNYAGQSDVGLPLHAEALPAAQQVWRHMLMCREGE